MEQQSTPTEVRSQFCEMERQLVMSTLQTVVSVLQEVLYENIEVVLHDLTRPESSVVAIANGHVTNRVIGDSILAGPKDDKGFEGAKEIAAAKGKQNNIITDYRTINSEGVELQSATAVFRDSDGIPFAGLCFNSDTTIPDMARTWLNSIAHKTPRAAPPPKPAEKVETLMDDVISTNIQRYGKPVEKMNREEKLNAVDAMQKGGLFIVRGGVNRAAKALGVTRFTIYNYLEELKNRSANK
ncbi:helix-turn-helix transcriptional regulator [Alteromonas gilva]|uniref:PAS domain-containing protein n=1 Tax=Alteromonas gilva TaxID=2987522 RepID=A0ABT5L4V7_9ALTE|nr:PAS domain-containing protein [Alteromonas gilva]MDC8831898.1 PAS domain-containing protein [Alteromonas gilva]